MYGCHNRKPLKDSAVVPDGWWQMDPKCAGCEHRKPAGKEAA